MSYTQKPDILDYQTALLAAAGNEQLAHRLLEVFIKQIPDYCNKINNALSAMQLLELQKSIHQLNGAVRYIGAPSLCQLVAELDGKLDKLSEQSLIKKIKLLVDTLEIIESEQFYKTFN